MTVVNNAFLDFIFIDDFLLHVLQEFDLLANESFDATSVERATCTVTVSGQPIYVTEPVLEHLKPVLRELTIQFAQIRNRTDRRENSVILNCGRTGTERRDHSDTLGCAQSTKSLVLDIAALQDDCGTL